MKKGVLFFAVFMIVMIASSAATQAISSAQTQEVVKDIAKTKGIVEDSIKDIEQVDFNNLPEEINIQNLDEANLELYKIDIGEEKPVYVITASQTKIKKVVSKFTNKMLLNFGSQEEISSSIYLRSATGVLGDLNQGYVMIREGSVTGISTNIKSIGENGNVQVRIFKNGELVEFKNEFDVEKNKIYTDYDTISEGLLSFYPGDIISVYVELENGVKVEGINTLLEITTN